MTIKKNDDKNLSRRKFLQGGAILGATAGLSTVVGGKTTKNVVQALGKKELDEFPVELSSDYKRYNQKNTVFSRLTWDRTFQSRLKYELGHRIGTDVIHDHVNRALREGGHAIDKNFSPFNEGGQPQTPCYAWEGPVYETKVEFATKEEASNTIKKAAKYLGADLVGITPYDEKWEYDGYYRYIQAEEFREEFPFEPKSIIVMAIEMDYDAVKTSPSFISDAATYKGYSDMAVTAFSVATFMRQLGYKSFSSGNDTSESVPYAIAAGLGELGRHGLLLTQEYGPRVRLCKVYTEMELAYDKPVDFGAMKFCEYCKRCAEACPSKSIPMDTERNFNTLTFSNHSGMKKWYVNVETCFEFWNENDTACAVCIASCPYNKPDFWHHRLTSAMTSTPLKPFLKEMDELFGYGHVFDEQTCLDFWKD